MAKVSHAHTVFKEELVVEAATISVKGNSFQRQRLKREDAAAVLLLNTDTNHIILTRQFRYAVHDKTEEDFLEIIAGKVDQDETPVKTAIRETLEETGYRVHEANMQLLMSCFSTPGYSSECFYLYYATVTDKDKTGEGGGLKEENESIEVVELDAGAFISMVKSGALKDCKTCVAGLYFANYL